jgi:hypothetical protein
MVWGLFQSMPRKNQVRTLNHKTFRVFLLGIGQVLGKFKIGIGWSKTPVFSPDS